MEDHSQNTNISVKTKVFVTCWLVMFGILMFMGGVAYSELKELNKYNELYEFKLSTMNCYPRESNTPTILGGFNFGNTTRSS